MNQIFLKKPLHNALLIIALISSSTGKGADEFVPLKAPESRGVSPLISTDLEVLQTKATVESFVSETISEALSDRVEKLVQLKSRGFVSPLTIKFTERDLEQESARARIKREHANWLKSTSESLVEHWTKIEVGDPQIPPIVQVPGLTTPIGGQLFFTVPFQLDDQILDDGISYLEKKTEDQTGYAFADVAFAEFEKFRSQIESLSNPLSLDSARADWLHFQAELRKIHANLELEGLFQAINRLEASKIQSAGKPRHLPWMDRPSLMFAKTIHQPSLGFSEAPRNGFLPG